MLLVLGTGPAWASSARVSGTVRDSAGTPQIGALVQLLNSSYSVIASTYTDSKGRFVLSSIAPGHYDLKAMDASFLPSMRENLRLRHGTTIVNLTLNTLYEVMQWLPVQPRASNARSDDWDWTLRSAADRPLLRWLENGPLVVVRDGPEAAPKLKARLMATGQAGTFGESGERFTANVEATPENSRELLARVDFDPNSNAGMESMLGFRQDLGYAGSVQSVAEIDIHPAIQGAGAGGLTELDLNSREAMQFGDLGSAEVGSTEALAHTSNGFIARPLPFAAVSWNMGNATLHYRMATLVEDPASAMELSGDSADAPMPLYSMRNGSLVLEHGMHQEIGWERSSNHSEMAVLVYADDVQNPALEAGARFATASAPAGALFDPESGLVRVAGPSYSSVGITAAARHDLPGSMSVRASYSSGRAIVMPALPREAELRQLIAAAQARNEQTYSLSFSGTLEGTHTRWQASYRWQPDDAITPIAPFMLDAMAPYLNLRICQRLHQSRDGSAGIEALLEVRNLLAEGYHPYLLGDGSILIFAADQRGLSGGLAFTF